MFPLKNSVFVILGIGFLYGIVINADNESHNKCGPGIVTPGWTVPRGDIVLKEGSDLDLYCVLDPNRRSAKNSTAKDLIFKNGNDPIDNKYVTVVNESTALLHLDDLPAMNEMFYCKLAMRRGESLEQIVCLNTVVVGSEPKEVTNFSCTSYNWEVLKCTWNIPNNHVKTIYSVYYQVPKRAGRSFLYACPTKQENSCEWSANSEPSYRKGFEYLNFLINGTNKFGVSTQQFKIHHFARVIPNAPKDLFALNKTPSSIYLQWNIGALNFFEKGLFYKIKYIWEGSTIWNVTIYASRDVEKNGEIIRVNVTGLPFPNIAYDFRVYARSSVASDDDGWSSPSAIVVKTKSCAPYVSPKTDIGGFEIYREQNSVRDVIVYWQQMPMEQQNGDDFQYSIKVMEEDKEVDVMPVLKGSSYAKFVNLSFNSYRFLIKAVNKEGSSENASVVRLPRKQDMVPSPTVFTKVDYGGGIYELSWRRPNKDENIVGYSAFSCESFRDSVHPCDGAIEWIHLPASSSKHNFNTSRNVGYQFALSANTAVSSSGMIWTSCTVLHNKVNKMKSVWVNHIGSSFIEVKWKLECSERIENIKGYRIYYCMVNESDMLKCITNEQNYTVYGDLNTISGNVSGLKPYTYYKLSVAMFTTDDQEGPQSDELVKRTRDAPPETKDIKIEIYNITSHSAVIKWSPPTVTNGLIDHYELHYNDEVKQLRNETEITLTGLRSYSQYSIKIFACTSACSRSDPVAVHTKIGTPSVVDKPTAVKINSTHAELSWNPPTQLGGPNPVYEVKIQYDEGDKVATEDIFYTTETKALISVPNCRSEDSHLSYTYYVRARNTDESSFPNPQTYYGDWSPAYTINCMRPGMSYLWMILIGLTSVVVLFSVAFFLYKKGMYLCQQMKSVQIILPPNFELPNGYVEPVKKPSYNADIKHWIGSEDAKSDIDQSSLDCMDMDTETDRTTSRSSSGFYTS